MARDGFSDDHPEVTQWLEDFDMDTEMLNDLLGHTFGGEADGDPVTLSKSGWTRTATTWTV